MSDTVIKPISEPARRLEIFTGAGRRRTWSAEQKAAIVAESLSGRESVCAVARRHGLTASQLFAWRRQARSRSVVPEERLSFASVVVGAAPIEIEFGGATIRVSAGSDAGALQAVLQAIKAVT
ncbi:transposase [Reyranella sp.]|uniref:transposase n=1 Tax=Reyranella sp. TaxID=1929291 RepID=UPI00272EED3F|nr:transposase [Reyranella sp.]MDP2374372.1 transposase [Reyranella sp.]